ncbi:MAG: 2-amino-4-hydroxy-6-hydroxymethyldihydropteridine diphosphokinase [Desulfobulbaceae bacterium]|nr:2-amino-4-hydroxy-6-hydroxymethyldihydropteridine diphosphokinase [Desulfobulbaceae bacterium]
MHTAFIGLGSNLGDSLQILQRAWASLSEHSAIELGVLASPYLSEPMDMESENWFVNSTGRLRTDLSPVELLAVLHETENRYGRKRLLNDSGYLDRPIDLDLLLYDDLVANGADVPIIPHPRMHERLFVLVPLDEIAPDYHHPVMGRSIRELLTDLRKREGQPEVRRIKWEEIL